MNRRVSSTHFASRTRRCGIPSLVGPSDGSKRQKITKRTHSQYRTPCRISELGSFLDTFQGG
jgi:hypothetical protein